MEIYGVKYEYGQFLRSAYVWHKATNCTIYCLNMPETGFPWPMYSRMRTESNILSLCENIQVRENTYFGIVYAVTGLTLETDSQALSK